METDASKILQDTVVQPGSPCGRKMSKGERLRIVDLKGKQAVDFLCYDPTPVRVTVLAAA